MALAFSLVDARDGATSDIVLGAGGDTTVHALAACLSASPAIEGTASSDLYLGTKRLDPESRLSALPLLPGARLGIGGPVPTGPGDAIRRTPAAPGGDGSDVLREVRAVGGPNSGRVWALAVGTYDLGAGAACALRPGEPEPGDVAPATGLTRQSAETPFRSVQQELPDRAVTVEVDADGTATVAPIGEARVELDGEPLAERREWHTGALLAVAGHLFSLAAPFRPDAAVQQSADTLAIDYNRPPRIMPSLEPVRILLPPPPHPPQRRPIPVLMSLAPLGIGVAMAFLLKSSFFLIFAVFSPVLAIAAYISDKRHGKSHFRSETVKYKERRAHLLTEVDAAVEHERTARWATGADPAAVILAATGPGARLWERRKSDADRLLLRVGTADLPSEVTYDDPEQDDHRRTVRPTARDVPVQIPLPDIGVLGVAGDDHSRRGLARWLVAQTAVLHSPRDVRMYVLSDNAENSWAWVRWLPHFAPPGRGAYVNVGNDAETVAARVAELVATVTMRATIRSSTMSSAMLDEPDILVVLDGARRLREVSGVVQILRDGPAVGVYAVCLDRAERLLPEETNALILTAGSGLTVRMPGNPDLADVRPDLVSRPWCERLARAVAPLRDATLESDGALPEFVRLAEVLGIDGSRISAGGEELAAEFAARWQRRAATTSAPLGFGFDGPMALDLVRDGPHALVAGTTGAGKSELLQSLVAGLAAGNRPDEMVFVLIDYKGGAAFKDCVDLPHTLGMVTDLDPHLTERALTSLGAELRRRETILAEAGAKDLPDYQAKRADDPDLDPLPRLVLIIDEFATLVREVPDFVPGLVGIAQRGRSLGIHLVLATQRPAGVVSSDIRANTNLRIALRVTDATESHDIIDLADAAGISPATPGRAMVRLGHGRVATFQTAYAGSPATQEAATEERLWATVVPSNGLGRPLRTPEADPESEPRNAVPGGVRTELATLVTAMGEASRELGVAEQPRPWLPALAQLIPLESLPEPEPGEAAGEPGYLRPVAYGLEDLPGEQRQRPAVIDLAVMGHLSVIGGGRSGRSQLIRTIAGALAQAHSCADVHLYGIDSGGGALNPIAELPHCGAMISRSDVERAMRLLALLRRQVAQRQGLLSRHDCANLTELRAAVPEAERPPHIVVFLDGWEGIAASLGDRDNGRLTDEAAHLLREGAAVGVHLVMTADRALLGGQIGGLNDNRLLLRLAERTDYTLVGIRAASLPTVIPAGRGWQSDTHAETQVAVLGLDASGPAQAAELARIGAAARTRDEGVPAQRRPGPVAGLPDQVTLPDAMGRVPAELRRPLWALVGVGGDDMGAWGVDLAGRSHIFGIAGPPGTGRSTLLVTMAASLLASGTRLILVTPRESPLRRLAAHDAVLGHFTGTGLGDAELEAALADAAGTPTVVLVDDADMLATTSADTSLRGLVATGRERGVGLVYAGVSEVVTQHMFGWLGEARRARSGALISPQTVVEGELLGTRLAADAVRRRPAPGRALVIAPDTGALQTIVLPIGGLSPAATE
ncbi:FtsK/SpoIIIE domain-containing protein [Streptomycetaceae bacterium NBC_01309]